MLPEEPLLHTHTFDAATGTATITVAPHPEFVNMTVTDPEHAETVELSPREAYSFATLLEWIIGGDTEDAHRAEPTTSPLTTVAAFPTRIVDGEGWLATWDHAVHIAAANPDSALAASAPLSVASTVGLINALLESATHAVMAAAEDVEE